MTDLFKYLCICVAVAGWAGAATFYVDSVDGLDDPTHSGGPGDPWQTLTYALSRTSGENTFMCRGTFEEEVTVAWEDRRSVFTANPGATLDGWLECEYETGVDLNGFEVYGYAAGGSKSGIGARDCYFNYPSGMAFPIARFYGGSGAYDCVFEYCKTVTAIGGFEFGRAYFNGCTVKDCGSGISYSGEATVSAVSCRFENVAGTAFSANIWGEFGAVRNCTMINCGTAVSMTNTWYGGYGTIEDSTFMANTIAITALQEVEEYGEIEIERNVVTGNAGNGATVGGFRLKLRDNVITDNGGHGVYITEGAPDLGTPYDPGGNTFAGNGSGYDVYNASAEDIMAYGNTWDPQSREEMAGKTWADVNVTRIYDRWDDPSVGYVKWSDYSTVTPASLGGVKASFAEGAVPASVPAPGMRFD
ncbi:MAG: right-handed parallel beta-helix repeat-containing protein [Candidatus Zixiibacteriota bacterium]